MQTKLEQAVSHIFELVDREECKDSKELIELVACCRDVHPTALASKFEAIAGLPLSEYIELHQEKEKVLAHDIQILINRGS